MFSRNLWDLSQVASTFSQQNRFIVNMNKTSYDFNCLQVDLTIQGNGAKVNHSMQKTKRK